MKFQDILDEAPEFGVEIIQMEDHVSFWAAGERRAFMMRLPGRGSRAWRGVTWTLRGPVCQKFRFEGSKARVANWCLDEAANGPR